MARTGVTAGKPSNRESESRMFEWMVFTITSERVGADQTDADLTANFKNKE